MRQSKSIAQRREKRREGDGEGASEFLHGHRDGADRVRGCTWNPPHEHLSARFNALPKTAPSPFLFFQLSKSALPREKSPPQHRYSTRTSCLLLLTHSITPARAYHNNQQSTRKQNKKQIPGCDNAYCKYAIVHGDDWTHLDGPQDGISQITRKTSGGPDQALVWNFPVEVTFKSTNAFGWPQLILSVFEIDALGRDVIRGYGLSLSLFTTLDAPVLSTGYTKHGSTDDSHIQLMTASNESDTWE